MERRLYSVDCVRGLEEVVKKAEQVASKEVEEANNNAMAISKVNDVVFDFILERGLEEELEKFMVSHEEIIDELYW